MSHDLLYRAMPIQDSSVKDELVLYGAMSIQDSSVIDELVLYGAMPIQCSSLKDELVLRCSPSKFIYNSFLKYE